MIRCVFFMFRCSYISMWCIGFLSLLHSWVCRFFVSISVFITIIFTITVDTRYFILCSRINTIIVIILNSIIYNTIIFPTTNNLVVKLIVVGKLVLLACFLFDCLNDLAWDRQFCPILALNDFLSS